MCSCQHKIHWSVVSFIVCVVALILYTTAVATPNWAVKTEPTYSINAGLFTTCTELNDTCYDTHVYFDEYDEKGKLLASAVINVFALIGMYLFFSLSVFFICGLFEEKALATGAIVTSYLSGLLAMVGTILYSATIKSLSWSLSWSFILAILGFTVNMAAGVLMCVGRNISTRKLRKKKGLAKHPVDEMRMRDTDSTQRKVPLDQAETPRKKVWATGADF